MSKFRLYIESMVECYYNAEDADLQEYDYWVKLGCWLINGDQEEGRRVQHYDIRDRIQQQISGIPSGPLVIIYLGDWWDRQCS